MFSFNQIYYCPEQNLDSVVKQNVDIGRQQEGLLHHVIYFLKYSLNPHCFFRYVFMNRDFLNGSTLVSFFEKMSFLEIQSEHTSNIYLTRL